MDNRFTEILEGYDFEIHNISRTRGAFLLDTDKGLKLLKCLEGSEKRVYLENEITGFLYTNGFEKVDCVVPNKDGEWITENAMGEKYYIKNWFRGEGFEAKEREKAVEGAAILGQLHKVLEKLELREELVREEPSVAALEKHTREMKRVRAYIHSKKKKNELEAAILENYGMFYEKALEAQELYSKLEYREHKVTHGSFTYHNVLFHKGKNTGIVNFDKAAVGFQITDLYYYLRKVMEKNDWSLELGSQMLEAYQKHCPIGENQWKVLTLLLTYPEKYWKICNHYYNTKKCWIAGRSIDKLEVVCRQESKKEQFLREVFAGN